MTENTCNNYNINNNNLEDYEVEDIVKEQNSNITKLQGGKTCNKIVDDNVKGPIRLQKIHTHYLYDKHSQYLKNDSLDELVDELDIFFKFSKKFKENHYMVIYGVRKISYRKRALTVTYFETYFCLE